MTEFEEHQKDCLSENNEGPIVFKYRWKPSGITKNEFETVPFIKQELNKSENRVFCNTNDKQLWNDNVTIDEIDIKTELSVTFDSEQTDSSDWGFNLLAEQLRRLADNQFISADHCYTDSPFTAKLTHAEETAADKLGLAKTAVSKNTKKNKKGQGVLVYRHSSYKSELKDDITNQMRSHSGTVRQALMCDHCPFVTLGKDILRRHIASHLPNRPTLELFQCHHCNYSVQKKYSLKRHMLRHLKTFPVSCDSCAFRCNTNCQLKSHNEAKHAKKRQTKTTICEICGKVIAGLSNVTAHMLTHKKGPHFFCTLCPYSGRCRKRYKNHVLTHSEDYKPPFRHACDMCDYTSEQLRHVRRHAITHTRRASGAKRRKSKKKEDHKIATQSVCLPAL